MQIVPVIDIRKGEVVRAIGGRRAAYSPIVTPLARTSAPVDVVTGLRARYNVSALYIADLDAIDGRGANDEAIDAIAGAFPHLRLWLDAGARDGGDVVRLLARGSIDPVLGSETFRDVSAFKALRDNPRIILSLDFRGRIFLGSEILLFSPALWPSRVVVMTLDRVGEKQGPDIARLAHIRATAPDRALYAAGGVRNADDLSALEKTGVAGALVSTALHDGALPERLLK